MSISLKEVCFIVAVAGLAGCAGNSADRASSRGLAYEQKLSLPEVKEGLIESNNSGPPYNPVWWRISSFASSGNSYKEGMVKDVYSKYPAVRHGVDEMFTPRWVVEVFKYGYKGGSREEGLKSDLQIYKVAKSEAEYKKAVALVKKAEELRRFGDFGESDLTSEQALVKKYKVDFVEGSYIVESSAPVLYKFKGSSLVGFNLPRFYDYMLIDGKQSHGDYGFYKIDGKPQKAKESSANINKRVGPGTYYEFNKPGNYSVKFSLAGSSVLASVKVVELPFKQYAPVDVVISKLGLPDSKEMYIESWPCSMSPNGFYHEPSASERVMSVTHFAYDKFPSLILEVKDGYVIDVGSKPKLALDEPGEDSCR